MAIAENTNWYDINGQPIYEMKGKTGKMVKPRVDLFRDSGGGYPGPTGVIKDRWPQVALANWKEEQIIKACFELMKDGTWKSNDEVVSNGSMIFNQQEFSKTVRRMSKEISITTANRGKELHKFKNQYFETGDLPEDEIGIKAITTIAKWLKTKNILEIESEKTFCAPGLGYAGSIDFVGKDGDGHILADFKTTDLLKFKEPHIGWGLQLAAYGMALKELGYDVRNTYSVVIDRETGDVEFCKWQQEKLADLEDIFLDLLKHWRWVKNYDPRIIHD